MRLSIFISVLLTVLMTGIGFSQEGVAVPDMGKIAIYEFGSSTADLAAMEEKIRGTSPDGYAAIEQDLLKVLDNPKTTIAGKQFVCRMLRVAGSKACLPAMGKLLKVEELSHMARYAIQGIDSPEVDNLFRDTIGDVNNKIKVGIIGSIGARRDSKAVPILAKFLNDNDKMVAEAAISALGRIGNSEATKVLAGAKVEVSLQNARDDSYIMCADNMASADAKSNQAETIYRELFDKSQSTPIRIASLRGLVELTRENMVPVVIKMLNDENADLRTAAPKFIIDMAGDNATKAFADAFPTLSEGGQIVMLNALAARGDKAAAPRVMELLDSKDEEVRIAALQSIGAIGDSGCIDKLIEALAVAGLTGESAGKSLSRLRGEGVDSAIIQRMQKSEPELKKKLIGCIALRLSKEAVPALLEASQDKDTAVRTAVFDALGILADNSHVPQLVGLLGKIQSEGERNALEKAIQDICFKNDDKDGRIEPLLSAYPAGNKEISASLLRMLGRLGGMKALETIHSALKDETLYDTAVRALVDSQNEDAADDLLNLAKSAPDEVYRILAMRGYVRLSGVVAGASKEKAINMYKVAMDTATRPDEKRLVLGGLGNMKSVESLVILKDYLDNSEINTEAASAIVKIAGELKRKNKKEVVPVLIKVVETCKSDNIVKKAESCLKGYGVTIGGKEGGQGAVTRVNETGDKEKAKKTRGAEKQGDK